MNSDFTTYNILEYLTPDNPIALAIVRFLQFVASLWFFGLIIYAIWLLKKQSQMIKCEDVKILTEARQSRSAEEEESKQNEIEVFSRFCNEKSIREQTPISKHLESIFLAGWTESRLELNELLNHTTQQLLQWNNLLRSILSTFIVIGLLGTLFGLADSLAHLSPVLGAGSSQQTNQGITQALAQLLTQMKSAFAPSILGVGLTVLGVFIYGLYLRFACSPVKTTLEWLTLTVWAPQLYPTISQKSEEQMRQNFEAACKVAEVADTVQSEMGSFSQNLSQANRATSSLTTAVSQINQAADHFSKFSEVFSESVSRLTSFQDELRTLYKQMVDESETFQKGFRNTLNGQNTRLGNILKTFKNYEDTYIAERGQIDAKLKQFLDEATETNISTNAKNRELVEQIREQLTTKLSEIENTLRIQLSGIVDKFDTFDAPINSAAEKIAGSQENLVKQMTIIIGDLQREFQKQNDNNKQQLEALSQLNQQIVNLLNQLAQNGKTQGTEIHVLNQNIQTLGTTIQQFAEQLKLQKVVREPLDIKSGKSNKQNRILNLLLFWRKHSQ